jgi:hypothetical protein
LRISRLLKLGVDDKHFESLKKKLLNADQAYTQNKSIENNHDRYLQHLLRFANQQETNGVIWPPLSNNAYAIYKHIHDIEPLNKTARESLANLFSKKLSLINDLLDKGHWYDAERELLALDKLYTSKNEQEAISIRLKEVYSRKNFDLQL